LTKVPPEAPSIPKAALNISKIRLAEIVPCNIGVVDTETVGMLIDSFRHAGQTSPILVVREDKGCFRVVCGARRVAAARELGWDHINAVVLACDERGERLVKIADDLHRRILSVLERAELTNEWIQLIHHEAMQDARPSGGRQPNDQGLSKAARALGVTKEQTMRCARIAGISPEAKSKARELGFGDNQAVLLQVAKLTTPVLQIARLQEISERKQAPRRATNTEIAAIEANAVPAVVSASTAVVSASEQPQEGDPILAARRRDDVSETLKTQYPDLLPGFDRRPVEAELEKLTDEWRSSRLRKMLNCAPIEARGRFIWEILFVDFPDAFVSCPPHS
jgi:hypothetical protein